MAELTVRRRSSMRIDSVVALMGLHRETVWAVKQVSVSMPNDGRVWTTRSAVSKLEVALNQQGAPLLRGFSTVETTTEYIGGEDDIGMSGLFTTEKEARMQQVLIGLYGHHIEQVEISDVRSSSAERLQSAGDSTTPSIEAAIS